MRFRENYVPKTQFIFQSVQNHLTRVVLIMFFRFEGISRNIDRSYFVSISVGHIFWKYFVLQDLRT